MEYIINILLEFIPILIVLTVGYIAALFIKPLNNKLVTKVYLLVSTLILVLVMLGTDNTYKHTTGYDKSLDVKSLEMRQTMKDVIIKDITPTTTSDEERKESFDEMVKYKSENKP